MPKDRHACLVQLMGIHSEQVRLCNHCLDVKPLSDFRRRSAKGDARFNHCRACHNELERMRRSQRCEDREWRQLASANAGFLRATDERRALAAIQLILLAVFRGNVTRFVESWLLQFEAIQHGKAKGSKRSMDFFRTVGRMIEFQDSHRADPRQLSDGDLDAAVLDTLVASRPELVIEAARRLGLGGLPVSSGPS